MKKIISLKTQRIMSFIPLANAFVLSVWLRNYRSAVNDSKVFAKSLLVLFVTTIPLGVVYMLLRAAGLAQFFLSDFEWSNWQTFFDEPRDQEAIKYGITLWEEGLV